MKIKIICLVLLLLGSSLIPAAEYRQGKLWLEVNLVTEKQLKLKPIASGAIITISEAEGLISRSYSGEITISIVNPDASTYFGILERKEIAEEENPDTPSVQRDFFAWEQGRLKIKHENLYYLPQSYTTKIEAEAEAKQLGLPASRVMEILFTNSTAKIEDGKGECLYLETPIKIQCDKEIRINGTTLNFAGQFVLKSLKGSLVLNHNLPLEEYVAGVVPNEIGNNSPLEALKAQAVAARTHALTLLLYNRHKADGYDLCSGTHCQVYKGKYLQNEQILHATEACEKEVLVSEEGLADATYHSSCGGKTDASSAIWKGKPLAHLNGVTCIALSDTLDLSTEANARKWIDTKLESTGLSSWERGAISWEKSISTKQLAKNAGLEYINRIEIVQRGRSGRITNMLLIGNNTVSLDNEYKIRQAFGGLMSSFFYIKGNYRKANGNISISPKSSLQIIGKGAGHGVGMCQVGALRLAREGSDYKEILTRYYPGTSITGAWMND